MWDHTEFTEKQKTVELPGSNNLFVRKVGDLFTNASKFHPFHPYSWNFDCLGSEIDLFIL